MKFAPPRHSRWTQFALRFVHVLTVVSLLAAPMLTAELRLRFHSYDADQPVDGEQRTGGGSTLFATTTMSYDCRT